MQTIDKKQKNWDRALAAVCLVCIGAYLLVFGLLNFAGLPQFCNSDVYADMQFARRAWEQKTLFPEGWTFGNQYYVIATPVLAALFYGLTGSMNLAMALATQVMTVLIILSLFWLLRAFTKDGVAQLVCCLLLVSSAVAYYGPYTMNTLLFFTQGSFYACYLITLFVVFGDYLRAGRGGVRPVVWCVSLLLCFATGMQSLRQTAVMILPLIAWEALGILVKLRKRERIWPVHLDSGIVRVFSYTLANLAGVALSSLLDIPKAAIYGQTQAAAASQWMERLSAIPAGIAEITSVDYLLAGDYSHLLAGVIGFFLILTAAAVIVRLWNFREKNTGLETVWLLLWIGIAGVLLSTVLLEVKLRGIYMFMWFPLVGLSGMMLLKKLPPVFRQGGVLVCCCVCLLGLLYCYRPYLPMLAQQEPTPQKQMSQWAEKQGYTYVYGEYWGAAPAIAVYSDGALEAGSWHSAENVFQAEPSNTPQDIYGEEENSRAIYVFTEEDIQSGLEKAKELGVSLKKVAEFGPYSAYTSPIPLMHAYLQS